MKTKKKLVSVTNENGINHWIYSSDDSHSCSKKIKKHIYTSNETHIGSGLCITHSEQYYPKHSYKDKVFIYNYNVGDIEGEKIELLFY